MTSEENLLSEKNAVGGQLKKYKGISHVQLRDATSAMGLRGHCSSTLNWNIHNCMRQSVKIGNPNPTKDLGRI